MRGAWLILGLMMGTAAGVPATQPADNDSRPAIHYSGPLTISPQRLAATETPSIALNHYVYSQPVWFVAWGWGYGGYGYGGGRWGW